MSKKKSTICILLLAIITIVFLPCLLFQKEKTEFTEANEMLAVFLGEEKSKTFPAKESGYVYDHIECTNDEEATWDEDTWKLTIFNITKETKCNVYFALGFTGKEFAYTGAVEEFTIPKSGNYKLEVWGAQGGGSGGAGGYSVGTVFLEKDTTLYVYVGEYGGDAPTYKKTFGGGGAGKGNSESDPRGNGGGATDIRIGEATLYHRVIVAGGGGGKAGTVALGGAGGGEEGILGYSYNSTSAGAHNGGAGTQIAAGSPSSSFTTSQYIEEDASFGIGGSSKNSTTIAGGGGGWYGGGLGNAGSGGSGWIYTEETFNVWQTGNPTDAANWKLDTKYYLKNASTIAGDQSIPTHDGSSTMTGNSGNGYAKITLVR